jgi:hypothetical protein
MELRPHQEIAKTNTNNCLHKVSILIWDCSHDDGECKVYRCGICGDITTATIVNYTITKEVDHGENSS